MARQRLTSKASTNNAASTYTFNFCWDCFILSRQEKGGSVATIDFYKRFYKRFSPFVDNGNADITLLGSQGFQKKFTDYLGDVNQQTINSYLRGYRAFGNFCKQEGYITGFKCPIKEVEPPIKQVYTDSELEKLIIKPKITEFTAFRTFCVISLILNTGARSNTILNIKLSDLDLEEGFITFNTTKAHKTVRLGLERKTKKDLAEWVNYWRIGKGAEPGDYLFCNEYGEQLSRGGLCKSLALYNESRGVKKTSIHLLRHTFAKKWITSGGDIITLAQVLTHSELEMVRRYSNLYNTDIKNAIEEHSAISQLKRKSGATLINQQKCPFFRFSVQYRQGKSFPYKPHPDLEEWQASKLHACVRIKRIFTYGVKN